MSAAVWVLLTVLAVSIGAEFLAWSAPLQRLLIRWTVAALPAAHRAQRLEEWYRELEEIPDGPITRLIFAGSLFLRRGQQASALRALGDPRLESVTEAGLQIAGQKLNRRNFHSDQAYVQAVEAVSRARRRSL